VTQLREFTLEGTIEGQPAVAHWRKGVLTADAELRRRAELVVLLGEEFAVDDGNNGVVRASLVEGGYAAMLTLMRAFSEVSTVEVALPGSPRARADRLFRSFRATLPLNDN